MGMVTIHTELVFSRNTPLPHQKNCERTLYHSTAITVLRNYVFCLGVASMLMRCHET